MADLAQSCNMGLRKKLVREMTDVTTYLPADDICQHCKAAEVVTGTVDVRGIVRLDFTAACGPLPTAAFKSGSESPHQF